MLHIFALTLMFTTLIWLLIVNPWMLCVVVSVSCFTGLMKHMMLVLLLLEFLSVLLAFMIFSTPFQGAGSVLIFMLIFTSIASEGAVSLSLFLVSARSSSTELSSGQL